MPIIAYHNNLNNISSGELTRKEFDLFFAFLLKFKQESKNNITLSFSEIKRVVFKDKHTERLVVTLNRFKKKFFNKSQEILLQNGDLVTFHLFNEMVISKERQEVSIEMNKRFSYLLNDLERNYTKFDLLDFISLKSCYSKNIFRFLKQFESTNFYIVSLDKFKELLHIPESYNMGKINQKVLERALEELKPFFPNLKIEKIKVGHKVEKLKFVWSSKTKNKLVKGERLVNSPIYSENHQKSQIRPSISEFESDKRKLFPKLLKFFGDLKKFEILNKTLSAVTTVEELNSFKLKYNL